MNLAERARSIANDRNQKIQTAIQEVANYFKEYLNSNKFEQLIEYKISDPINQNTGYGVVSLEVKYEYVEGQKEAVKVITLGGKKWICPDNFYKTYEISFCDIEKEVCQRLHAITEDKLREMGFTAEQYDAWAFTHLWIKFSW